MANIIHTSTAATNTPVNLAVNGSAVGLPQKSNIWFNWQIDSGLSVSDGRVQSWTDSENSIVLANASGSPATAPLHSATYKLAGLNTVRFVSGVTGALKKEGGTGYVPTNAHLQKTTFVLLARSVSSATYQEYLLSYSASNLVSINPCIHGITYPGNQTPKQNYITTIGDKFAAGDTFTHFDLGEDIINNWHVIQVSIDYITKDVSLYLDGILVATTNTSGLYFDNYTSLTKIYTMGGYFTPTTTICSLDAYIAAAIGWENIILSPEEALAAATYLMTKYGLT